MTLLGFMVVKSEAPACAKPLRRRQAKFEIRNKFQFQIFQIRNVSLEKMGWGSFEIRILVIVSDFDIRILKLISPHHLLQETAGLRCKGFVIDVGIHFNETNLCV